MKNVYVVLSALLVGLVYFTCVNADDTTVAAPLVAESTTAEPDPTCTADADCNGHGSCENSTCICDPGYATHKGVNCNYQQKKKLTAFLLSLLIGTAGADWFYLANGSMFYIIIGVVKLATGVIGIGLPCFLGCLGCLRSDGSKVGVFALIVGLVTLVSLANGVWWLVDWIRLLVNAFKDGNGVGLQSW